MPKLSLAIQKKKNRKNERKSTRLIYVRMFNVEWNRNFNHIRSVWCCCWCFFMCLLKADCFRFNRFIAFRLVSSRFGAFIIHIHCFEYIYINSTDLLSIILIRYRNQCVRFAYIDEIGSERANERVNARTIAPQRLMNEPKIYSQT